MTNAVQTNLPNLTGVLSFATVDLGFAREVEVYFPSIEFKLERDVIPPPPSSNELRMVILSPEYAQLPNALLAAQQAASRSQLVILLPRNGNEDYDELASPNYSEGWTDLALEKDFVFVSLEACELYLLKTRVEVDYPCVVQIDDYLVVRELGFGAQGVVYEAEHVTTKQQVAIKEIRNTPITQQVSSQAQNEIAVMKRLDHPNLTKLFSVFQQDLSLFLVLEYVAGGALCTDDAVWQGTSPVVEDIFRAQSLFQQLVRGTAYLHRMGVLHRDIKPSNILGGLNQGLIKLADFGVSSFTDTSKSTRILGEDDLIYVGSSGTPAFLPPEASGASVDLVYNGRGGDVWSLGVTFYVLLMGRLPFRGNNRSETSELICTQETIPFPKAKFPTQSLLHKQCKQLILKMLTKDPARRITLAGVCDDVFLGELELNEMERGEFATGRKRGTSTSTSFSQAISFPKTFSQRVRRRSVVLRSMGRNLFAKTPPPPVTTTMLTTVEMTLGEQICQFFIDLGLDCGCGADRKPSTTTTPTREFIQGEEEVVALI